MGPRQGAPNGDVVSLGNAVVLPGLVNTHTHLELTALRGYLADQPFRQWLIRLTAAREQALSLDALRASARLGIAEGLLAGVTTFADSSASGVVLAALHEMGARGVVYQEVFGPHPDQCEASLHDLRDRLTNSRDSVTPLVRLGVSPHAPYSVSDELYSAVANLARDQALPLAAHIAESQAESRFVVEGAGPFAESWRSRGIPVRPRASSPIALLSDTGVLACRPLLIHCVQASREDVALLAAMGCSVAHCPASNAKLGHGCAPLMQLLNSGVQTGLGSDSVDSNDRMDILEEARLAALFARAAGRAVEVLPATQALRLATLGGALALGLADEIGSLEVGKAADLAAFRLDAVRD
ncbi:MAG: amidohydrolase family protein, partial [Gemmatimonadaceae bacterium]